MNYVKIIDENTIEYANKNAWCWRTSRYLIQKKLILFQMGFIP